MSNMVKSLGQVIGLVLGDKITTPSEQTMKSYPDLTLMVIYQNFKR